MGQCTDCDVVNARRRDSGCIRKCQTTRCLEQHSTTHAAHGLCHLIGSEVVEQHKVSTCGYYLVQLVKRINLNLNWNARELAANRLKGGGNSSRCDNMVVLDQRCVRQSHSMIDATAAADCVLLQQ